MLPNARCVVSGRHVLGRAHCRGFLSASSSALPLALPSTWTAKHLRWMPMNRTISSSSVSVSLIRSTSFVAYPSSLPSFVTRRAASSLSEAEVNKRLNEFQDLFVEARLCIEDATESAGTKYFEDDVEAATDAVNEAVQAFQNLIDDMDDENEKNRILRSNGLKVEQLKGELEMALHGGHDH